MSHSVSFVNGMVLYFCIDIQHRWTYVIFSSLYIAVTPQTQVHHHAAARGRLRNLHLLRVQIAAVGHPARRLTIFDRRPPRLRSLP